eukprot:CAMPEP_0177646534 /NCGR_PEP_ID=MMETSP0447-20121125/9823_1 /TAXON_ID=0 /ORGANISM="Stygamoeba regulata, Strain BSH-02190019" /LENGTH=477 /DNA_ID=CAMNT_0019149069 /DNA_START=405 /DNA_END=1838 /DNA_ORIENTATION=-
MQDWKTSKSYPNRIRVLQAPTPEMVLWTEGCLSCVAPTIADPCTSSIFTGICTVTPLTNVTNFSLDYQLYLNLIFHRHNVSYYTHVTTMPLINMLLLVVASFCKFSDQPSVSWIDLSLVIACAANLWYLVWGITSGVWWMGISALPVVWACFAGAQLYADALLGSPLDEQFRWYDPGPLAANPLLWIAVLSLAQCISHVPEDLPPRVSGTPHWMSRREFFCGHVRTPCDLAVRLLRALLQTLFGTVDELLASPRLLALFWGVCPTYYLMCKLDLCTEWSSRRQLDELWSKAREALTPLDRPCVQCGLLQQEKCPRCEEVVVLCQKSSLSDDEAVLVDDWCADAKQADDFVRRLNWVLDNVLCFLCPKVDRIADPALDYIGIGGGTFLRSREQIGLWRVLTDYARCRVSVYEDQATLWELDYESAKLHTFPLTEVLSAGGTTMEEEADEEVEEVGQEEEADEGEFVVVQYGSHLVVEV